MKQTAAIRLFESLSSNIRLDIYRLLIRYGTEGLVAGRIGETLDTPPNKLSFHLRGMTDSGLLTVEQEGRFMRYRANIPLMLELIAYLTEECCAENPEQCATMRAHSPCSGKVLPPLSRKTTRKKL